MTDFLDRAQALRVLKKESGQKAAWYDLAQALMTLEAEGAADADGRPWIYLAGDLSGYGANQLRRMTRALSFLKRLEDEKKISAVSDYQGLPISSIDLIVRLDTINPALAMEMLASLKARKITYHELNEKYETALKKASGDRDGQRAGRRAELKFDKICFELVKASPQHFAKTLKVDVLLAYRLFDRVSPDIVLVQHEHGGIKEIDGVTCKAFSSSAHSRFFRQTIQEVAFEATFFRNFWVMIAAGEFCDRLITELDAIGGFENVSIAAVHQEADEPAYFIVKRLANGWPTPDRRSALKTDRIKIF